ncbi:hypothetical protein [Zunongwangia sp. HRR-M8]|uniref:hypothetical protein n=1 Tax=Zunongwangia sp. HRR-M8 TaxID=3015170 RepID=UPI0022DD9378|nr:hypothetical protein [Zunongwangia sp. HRR-M8]WBL23561.1 hypothetical protein PBT89_06265 [Zunongwangia sp. HRR-M8]
MKKEYIFLLIFALSYNIFSAQSFMNGMQNSAPLKIFTKKKTPERFTGSPYIDDSFLSAQINDGERSMSAFVRYNAVEDVVEVKIDEQNSEIYTLPKLKKIKYKLKDYEIFIDQFTDSNGETVNGYMLDYFSNQGVRFLARPEPDVVPAQPARTGYDKDKPAHLKVDMVYYLQKNGGRLEEVRLREKDFKKILSDKEKMNAYFDRNKIKNEEDVVKMLKFYTE